MFGLGKPTKAAFVSALTSVFKQAGLNAEYDEATFTMTVSQARIQLTNIYDNYCGEKSKDRPQVLAQIVQTVAMGLQRANVSPEEARQRLQPKAMTRAMIERFKVAGQTPPHVLLAEPLAIGLILDYDQAVRSLKAGELDEWGLSLDEAMKIARDNLWAISNEPFREVAAGTYRANYGDNNDASRIALQSLIFQLKVKGDHVALVPDRDTLLITGSADTDGLARLLKEAENLERNYPVCPLPLRLRGDQWEVYKPEDGHPLAARFARHAWDVRARQYGDQKHALDEHFEQTGVDIHVASCMVVTNDKTGEYFTVGVWVDGVECLLPETDLVAFMEDDKPKEQQQFDPRPWTEVREQFSGRMEATEYWPARWRVNRWK